jgi:acyl-CoA thioesterase-1
VIYIFGSGLVFFLGVGVLLATALILQLCERRWLRRAATPLPYWFYVLAAALTIAWLIAENRERGVLAMRQRLLCMLVAAVWLAGVAVEAPYHWMAPMRSDSRDLYIIGDSVAAGMSTNEAGTWPRLLAESGPWQVHDLARMGATVASALKQVDQLPSEGGLVLLEIGGNDLLGSTSAAKYEEGLERLLKRVCVPGRTVVIFELPLPPLGNEFGRIQRRLAAQYGVTVIPKRIFIGVLTTHGATVDGVHLSKRGHERMAEVVRELVR